jgi:tetratricopeptide (TPR) repeat protein
MKLWLVLFGAVVLAGQSVNAQQVADSAATRASDSSRVRITRVLRARGINPAVAEFWRLREQDSTATPESLLNDIGYDLLKQSRVDDAIRAFRANIAAYPESPRVYEAIGDAYLAGGHRTAARDGYRRAAELDSTMTRSRRLADSLNAHLRH